MNIKMAGLSADSRRTVLYSVGSPAELWGNKRSSMHRQRYSCSEGRSAVFVGKSSGDSRVAQRIRMVTLMGMALPRRASGGHRAQDVLQRQCVGRGHIGVGAEIARHLPDAGDDALGRGMAEDSRMGGLDAKA